MKGQSTIEFLGSTLLFVLAIFIAISSITGDVNKFQDSFQDDSHNMHVYSFTESFLSGPGYKSDGNDNWEVSPSETVKFGLAEEYHVIEKDKLEAMDTVGSSKLNYSKFKDIIGTDYNYNFEFVWLPVIDTSKHFTRTKPPSNPPIIEPNSDLYKKSELRVHYGDFKFNNTIYKFLVTAHDDKYNTTRVSKDWDFSGEEEIGVNEKFKMDNANFTLKAMQNRDKRPGTVVILNRTVKEFGASPEGVDKDVIKLNRYGVLKSSGTELEPIRIEVLSW